MHAAETITAVAKKRGYNRQFTPTGKQFHRYLLDRIPDEIWGDFRKRCKREGVSARAKILTFIVEWIRTPGGR